MALPVTMYRWDDVGAPQITTGSPTEYINVFVKCLVEGYGTKESVGWQVLENQADSPFLALKNNIQAGGSGGNFIILSPNDSNYTRMTVTSALEYNDKSNYSKVGRINTFSSYSSGENLMKNWIIFATPHGFYFFAAPPSLGVNNLNRSRATAFFYCGDLIPSIPNDPTRFLLLSGSENAQSSYDNVLQSRILTGNYFCCNYYAIDGDTTPQGAYIQSIFGIDALEFGQDYISAKPQITMLHPLFIVGSSKSLRNDNSIPLIKGQAPGLYLSPQVGYGDESLPFYKFLDGEKYFSVPSTEKSGTGIWLNTEVW